MPGPRLSVAGATQHVSVPTTATWRTADRVSGATTQTASSAFFCPHTVASRTAASGPSIGGTAEA